MGLRSRPPLSTAIPLVLALLLVAAQVAAHPSTLFAASEPGFGPVFQQLARQIPQVVGKPVEAQRCQPDGDCVQRTTTGLLVWRKADSWPAFTDGTISWINGPYGVQSRSNDHRYPWEASVPPPPPPPPALPVAAALSATSGPVAPLTPAPPSGQAAAVMPPPSPGHAAATSPPPSPAQRLAVQTVAQTIVPAVAQPPSPQPAPVQVIRPASPVASSSSVPRFGVAESFRNDASTQLGISWDRIVLSWSGLQPDGPSDWRADSYFSPDALKKLSGRGWDAVAVLQFTPTWAARDPGNGQRSVPRNLQLPANSRDNPWAQFAGRVASHYKGRIDRFIIWNEPEFKPGDKGVGQAFTWLGTDEEYYLLLKRAYQAIKAANPNAVVIFGATSYWVDANMGREPFFKRILNLAAADPEAKANNYFFDVAAFNIYRAPDDLLRIHVEMKQAMKDKGIDKPIWLTETNAMPYDDPATPKPQDGQRVTLAQQADYVTQSLAISAAAGYERVGWYRITDGGMWQQQEAWGLLHDDGRPRPAFQAFKTAANLFNGARRVSLVPLERADRPFGTPWPQNPNSYYPNWEVYQVIFDHPDGRRVTVLWNATGSDLRVQLSKHGSSATLIDGLGNAAQLAISNGSYVVNLPRSEVSGPGDPPGYHFIGGRAFILEERGVPTGSPVEVPRLEH